MLFRSIKLRKQKKTIREISEIESISTHTVKRALKRAGLSLSAKQVSERAARLKKKVILLRESGLIHKDIAKKAKCSLPRVQQILGGDLL